MRTTVDFSLFSDPSTAYAGVSGPLDVDESIREGDLVRVLPTKQGDSFSGVLRVTSVVQFEGGGGGVVVGLDDVVLYSVEDAKALAARFEREAGLFVDVY